MVVHSDFEDTSDFHSSHAGLTQLYHNILRGMKGNFVDVPTDCPQRNERLGWTGDAEVFAETALRLGDTQRFFRKWLRDMAAAQLPDGGIPHVVPDILTAWEEDPDEPGVLRPTGYAACGWADAAVIIPWRLYERYGNRQLLAEHYPMMRNWVEYIRGVATDGVLWDTGFHFGDWVALDAEEGSYLGATPNPLTATAHYAWSTQLLAQAARVLDRGEEAVTYEALWARIREAFQGAFVGEDGRLTARTQTACLLALQFDLLTDEQRGAALDLLIELIEEAGGALTTGFLGTPWLCEVLGDNGALDLAYQLLLREDYPSWLYSISKGATTIWEHWDGIKPDGSLWSPDMNSFNHYAYGAVGSWIGRVVGGIRSASPYAAFRELVIAPKPGGELTWVDHGLETGYGKVRCRWEVVPQGAADGRDKLELLVEVPANCTATVILPWSGAQIEVGSGQHHFEDARS